jgi:hypothetical protein
MAGPEFKTKVLAISKDLGCDPNHFMAAMAFETGERFSSRKNRASGATGLIQFMPTTKQYNQNVRLDTNHDGQVTKGEAASKMYAKLAKGLSTSLRG